MAPGLFGRIVKTFDTPGNERHPGDKCIDGHVIDLRQGLTQG
jgi:hypothetical protein